MGWKSIRTRLVGDDDSWSARRRAERWAWFTRSFPDLDQMSVVDLGGVPHTWTQSPVRPKQVHVLNIEPLDPDVPDWIEVDYADACDLPAAVSSRRYDLVFSNSVLEHVGGHERRMRFAENTHKLAGAHWVQTPYRYFPIEPHWVAPGMQFLPVRARATLAQKWPLANVRSTGVKDALDGVLWTELVDRTQMRYLFPDSQIINERLAGLTKSIIAVKKG